MFRLEFEQNGQLNSQLLIGAEHYTDEPPKTKKSKTDGSNLIGLFRQIYNEKRALIGHAMSRLSVVNMDEKKMRWIFGLSGGECDDTIKSILSSLNDVNQTSWCDYKARIDNLLLQLILSKECDKKSTLQLCRLDFSTWKLAVGILQLILMKNIEL